MLNKSLYEILSPSYLKMNKSIYKFPEFDICK